MDMFKFWTIWVVLNSLLLMSFMATSHYDVTTDKIFEASLKNRNLDQQLHDSQDDVSDSRRDFATDIRPGDQNKGFLAFWDKWVSSPLDFTVGSAETPIEKIFKLIRVSLFMLLNGYATFLIIGFIFNRIKG